MAKVYRKDRNHVLASIDAIESQNRPAFIVHVETSGLDASEDEILEISIIRCEMHQKHLCPTQTYHSYINQGIHVPDEITRINHISDELLLAAPAPATVAKEIYHFMGETPDVVGFSTDFVCKFLISFGFMYGYPVFPAQAFNIQDLANCCMDYSIANTRSLAKIVRATKLGLDISDSRNKAASICELFNYFIDLFPTGEEPAIVTKMRLFAPSRKTRYVYIDTDHGRVSVDACSGFVCEETPGFFDTVNIEDLIDKLFDLRHVTTMKDFVATF